jgi:uroporphyrinogen decarboxylase
MNSRERVLAAVSHVRPDRVPIGLRFSPELTKGLKDRMGLKSDPELWNWVGQDLITVRPKFRSPAADKYYADPTIEITPEGHYLDIYRVPFRWVQTEYQAYMELVGRPPLAHIQTLAELENFPWPGLDLWDFSTIPGELELHREKATWARSRGLFEIACFMRGMEQLMTDFILDPDFAAGLMDRITEGLLAMVKKTLAAGRGGYVFYEYNDDIASQRAMLISPKLWREFIKPRMAKICDMIHSFNTRVRYHSCGSVYPIIPDLIEMGVDILNPIQPLAQDMDPFRLKKEFGDRLTLDGGIDIQFLLPKGSVGDVRREVRKMIDITGANGGYICAGSHTLQGDIPLENIIALVEEAQR